MKNLDMLFIDFYGTIADGDRHAVESTCSRIVKDHRLGVKAQDFAVRWGRNFFATADASNHDQFMSLYECECCSLVETLLELGCRADPVPYVDQVRRYWRHPPLHAEAKDALAALPVPVCCVSNVDEQDLRSAAAAHALVFDHFVSSERARSYKPDARIFQLALQETGVSPERCVHVGDSLHSDIAGAQRVGIKAVWLHRDGRISDIGSARPDHTITSLMELQTLFS